MAKIVKSWNEWDPLKRVCINTSWICLNSFLR